MLISSTALLVLSTCSHGPAGRPPDWLHQCDAPQGRGYNRFSRRTINFNPDHVSSTAQTFTSTNPSGNATSRMVSSVISVATPEDFFGHEIQSIPVSAINLRSRFSSFSSTFRSETNKWTKTAPALISLVNETPAGSGASNFR